MLITHHPLIFKSLKQINDGDFIGRRIIRLIQADIAYYAMHTNYRIKNHMSYQRYRWIRFHLHCNHRIL